MPSACHGKRSLPFPWWQKQGQANYNGAVDQRSYQPAKGNNYTNQENERTERGALICLKLAT